MQHFVVEHVGNDKLRDPRAIHAAVQDDLIGTRVVAAKLAAPAAGTPTDVRTRKSPCKILLIQALKQRGKIVMAALCACSDAAHAAAAHAVDAPAHAFRARVG